MKQTSNLSEKFMLVKPSNRLDGVLRYARNGGLRGIDVGFNALKGVWSFGSGTTTDITGFPTSGKSQFALEILLNVSKSAGKKHLLFMPDVGSELEIIADLLHKGTGKTFDKRYNNRIDDKTINVALPSLDDSFTLISQRDLREKITPYDLFFYAAELKERGVIDSLVIDSWKDLYHDTRGFNREDNYLAYTLKQRNQIAERSGLHIMTIIHPTKPQKQKDGSILPPTAYDLKGGSEWFNNGKSIITVHRPDIEKNITEIDFRKVKPRSLGTRKKVFLHFDMIKFRYYEKVNGADYYAYEYKNSKASGREQDILSVKNVEKDDDELPF